MVGFDKPQVRAQITKHGKDLDSKMPHDKPTAVAFSNDGGGLYLYLVKQDSKEINCSRCRSGLSSRRDHSGCRISTHALHTAQIDFEDE